MQSAPEMYVDGVAAGEERYDRPAPLSQNIPQLEKVAVSGSQGETARNGFHCFLANSRVHGQPPDGRPDLGIAAIHGQRSLACFQTLVQVARHADR